MKSKGAAVGKAVWRTGGMRLAGLVALTSLLAGTAPAKAGLVGKWTFDNARESTGNFTNLTLVGGCTISNGMLHVDVNKYAYAMGYTGPTVTTKTLVAWAYMDSLTTYGGSLLSFLKNGTHEPVFDGIVYGERTAQQWMAGSENWKRSPPNNGGALETNGPNTLIQIAIVYDATNGITIYRNGALYADRYVQGTNQTYSAATNTYACFGMRLFYHNSPNGWVKARITEARIYDEALTQSQIAALKPVCRGTVITIR